MNNTYLFTSESVTEGHPDKMCDILSDAILDAYLEKDPNARVACEVTATTGIISVMGEITSNAIVDIERVVRETVEEIGYVGDQFGFNAKTCEVIIRIDKQSEDINMGVSSSKEYKSREVNCNMCDSCLENDNYNMIGAGDQGMMFGYACDETESLMPAPLFYAHKLCHQLSYVRKNKVLDYLGPDGKSMVTFEYRDDKPVRIDTIVVSTQHKDNVPQDKILSDVKNSVIMPVIPNVYIDDHTKILVNPTGRFVKGGPSADTGLTGRKIIVDTYGGMGRHGGGAFSGKDATKVDRTGAYAARYVAKNIVAAKIAKKCEVQIAYAIGVANPVSVYVNTFGTSNIPDEDIIHMINAVFELRPASIIERFQMREPIYKKLAAYGHFGRLDCIRHWENVDKVGAIKKYFHQV
ncbi:methionine adenosyltransferase [Anaerosporobacter faecicola]|uniref:methionine adenosyltransferase n=1 Tax=Anaerosporobacter faecicola TaxID=2718714 RepID=UPI00143C8227|nr:methionine adenosyltransferase [Anaerosporobacter faecicola]